MTNVRNLALIVAAAVMSAGLMSTTASSAPMASPIVPARVQQTIRKRVDPVLAYIPTYLPAGYHFDQWAYSQTSLGVVFTRRRGQVPEVSFNVSRDPCPLSRAMRTIRSSGMTVYWSTTYEDAEAWSCVKRGNVRLLFLVGGPGDGLKTAPKAEALARMIVSAKRIS